MIGKMIASAGFAERAWDHAQSTGIRVCSKRPCLRRIATGAPEGSMCHDCGARAASVGVALIAAGVAFLLYLKLKSMGAL